MTAETPDLRDRAEIFANELTETFAQVLGSSAPAFVAEASPRRRGSETRVSVHTEHSVEIPVTIAAEHALSLVVDFECRWDHRQMFLAVRKANFHVLPAGQATPLFRYEFVEGMQATLPCAHLQIHAHRDELLYTMFRGGRGRPAARARTIVGDSPAATPRLADVHFPLGGPRMRPGVEDILQMLITEFGIDVEPGAQEALNEGRARWRRRQIAASVRDAPEEVIRVLKELGYKVEPPTDGALVERLDKLTRM